MDKYKKIYKIYKNLLFKKVIQHFFIKCNTIFKKNIKKTQNAYFLKKNLKINKKPLTIWKKKDIIDTLALK